MRKELNQILKNGTKLVALAQIKYGDLIEMATSKNKRNIAILKAIQIEHDNNNPEKNDFTEFELINKLKDTVYYMKSHRLTQTEIEIDILHDDRVEIKQGRTRTTLNRNFNGYSEKF